MSGSASAMKRAQFRLRADDKEMLLLAASCDGASLSAFIRKAALEAARSVVDPHDRFELSREEAKAIVASLKLPLVPNEAPSKAMETAERIETSSLKA